MKIIKSGNIYGFECPKCKTIFVAGIAEIQSESGSTVVECNCPLCGSLVRETCTRSIELLCKMEEPNAEQSQ